MKIARLFLIIGVIIVVAMTVVACGGNKATAVPTTVKEQPPVSSEAEPTSSAGESEPVGEVPSSGPDMPPDVPVMDGYRDFQATSDFTNISYVVDGSVEDVVSWYQEQLPQYGWEMSRAPDSALGSIANMSRINANNDRLTLSLQHNPIGQFSVIRIVVVRQP